MVTKIGSKVGAYMNQKKNKIIFFTYFNTKDDDVIYDVIIEEPVWKWCQNYRHEFSNDQFAELPVFKAYLTIFIFKQIDRANFAVRGPSSFLK